MSDITVNFAVYGAQTSNGARAEDVTQKLAAAIQANANVPINNNTFGDPAVGYGKHFAASVTINGVPHLYACGEGETIHVIGNFGPISF
ncbi:MAG: hypothetical protein ABIT83_00965 [Massilia sp.]